MSKRRREKKAFKATLNRKHRMTKPGIQLITRDKNGEEFSYTFETGSLEFRDAQLPNPMERGALDSVAHRKRHSVKVFVEIT